MMVLALDEGSPFVALERPSREAVLVCGGAPWAHTFRDAIVCASALAARAAGAQAGGLALVFEDVTDVAPVNLGAALKIDEPTARVVLVSDTCDAGLRSNARSAGIDAVIDSAQAWELLAGCREKRDSDAFAVPTTTLVAVSVAAPTVPPASASVAAAVAASVAPPVAAPAAASASTPDAPPAPTPSPTRGLVLTVVSGCGGVGRSSAAVLLALLARQRGVSTALCDFDLQFGSLGYLLGGEIDAGAVLRHDLAPMESDPLDSPSLPAPSDRLLLLRSNRGPEYAELFAAYIPRILAELSSSYQLTIVDTGAYWTDVHAALLESSDIVLFMMDQRATSIRSCVAARELCLRMGAPAGKFRYALNRCAPNAQVSAMDASFILGREHVFELLDGGRAVDELCGLGTPGALLNSRNAFPESLGTFLDELFEEHAIAVAPSVRKRGRPSGLFARRHIRGVFRSGSDIRAPSRDVAGHVFKTAGVRRERRKDHVFDD